MQYVGEAQSDVCYYRANNKVQSEAIKMEEERKHITCIISVRFRHLNKQYLTSFKAKLLIRLIMQALG